jgi:ribosomal protein S18 acetylase RimI-like enzyme
VTFRYFAYGSNLWLPRMTSRCPSARPVGTATLEGWVPVYDKPSVDGSAKLNIRADRDGVTAGVIYELDESDRPRLDAAEPGYDPIETSVGLTYAYRGEPATILPHDWYVATVARGAASHGIPTPETETSPDPIAPGLRPADGSDLGVMQAILADGLRADDDRHYAHPGELGWWMFHWDQRRPLTWWIQGDDAFAVIDTSEPGEISVFARPEADRLPLISWARQRLHGRGEVAWVSDADGELTEWLLSSGYAPSSVDRAYEWDLTGELPRPSLPADWHVRAVAGEHEADNRRSASHAAFESTMSEQMHLDRYLKFMRSPVYAPERDLVVVSPEGRIASFMVWWPDDSGIAQIEPFGTHPDFHRRGLGRALLLHGLHDMRHAGMHTARVLTNDWRDATAFYEDVGFRDVGRIQWWAIPSDR